MTSGVRLKLVFCCAVAVLLLTVPAWAETVVKCAKPPGEEVKCESSQAAICDVKEGAVYGSCSTPPKESSGHALNAWLLSSVFGRPVAPDEVAQGRHSDVLVARRWQAGSRIVTFRPPTQR